MASLLALERTVSKDSFELVADMRAIHSSLKLFRQVGRK